MMTRVVYLEGVCFCFDLVSEFKEVGRCFKILRFVLFRLFMVRLHQSGYYVNDARVVLALAVFWERFYLNQ